MTSSHQPLLKSPTSTNLPFDPNCLLHFSTPSQVSKGTNKLPINSSSQKVSLNISNLTPSMLSHHHPVNPRLLAIALSWNTCLPQNLTQPIWDLDGLSAIYLILLTTPSHSRMTTETPSSAATSGIIQHPPPFSLMGQWAKASTSTPTFCNPTHIQNQTSISTTT